MLDAADLADNITALKAMLIAAQAREVRKDERIERLEKLGAAFKQSAFGRKSEKADPEQFDLALEYLETVDQRRYGNTLLWFLAAIQKQPDSDAPQEKST